MSTFTDAQSNIYSPNIVNTLTWKYTPRTIIHAVLNDALGNSKVTNIGQGVLTGHLAAVFELAADANAFAVAVCLGVEFTDADHYLNNQVLVASSDVSITQDATTQLAFVVEFDWTALA
ncbi:hypothetical protein HII28_00370 [Planctomonas sp. JC2975]|uniref:hypothetical protein n=1 Tax=Planctomonas sp. JC2975 TaxID=2729626 RepID=UPI001473FB5B|nr:hypothetical protein [Planctomonas sp. JC2975]NNC10339.1 hypothetical protein [Planctomonas sp. JC2975]